MSKLLFFTEAEYLLMLALAGGENCTICPAEPEPDRLALTEALISLYRRNLICRKGNDYIPYGDGEMFYALRDAGYVAILNSYDSTMRSALCYLTAEDVWVVELIRQGYRVQHIKREAVASWLFDAGLLQPAALDQEDVSELVEIYQEELPELSEDRILQIEKRRNGGEFIRSYEILRGPGVPILRTRDGLSCRAVFCTQVALSEFLSECFSEES